MSHIQLRRQARACVCVRVCVRLSWLQGIGSTMTCVPLRSANSSEAAVPSPVTTRLPLPLVSFQKPLLQVLVCIFGVGLHIVVCLSLGFRANHKPYAVNPMVPKGIQPLVLQLALELLQGASASSSEHSVCPHICHCT